MLISDPLALSNEQKRLVQADLHFGRSAQRNVDPEALLRYYKRAFVDVIHGFRSDRTIGTIADIGSGYGWLSFAVACATDCRIIAVDNDQGRQQAAQRIAGILGISQRIEWRLGSLGRLPLGDKEADAVFCIEVIEHAAVDPAIMRDLGRVTSDLLIVTSPNKLFPVINHDTRLPFCHWLNNGARDRYAALFSRSDLQDGNQFWRPGQMISELQDFDRVSRFLHFPSYREYQAVRLSSAEASPDVGFPWRQIRDAYFRCAATAGKRSIYLLPNIASTFRRRPVAG
jgi:SAM-dependent methyltransferase